jgi:hypothetical protein
VPIPVAVADELDAHLGRLGVTREHLVFPAPEGGLLRLGLSGAACGIPQWPGQGSTRRSRRTSSDTPRSRCGQGRYRPGDSRRSSGSHVDRGGANVYGHGAASEVAGDALVGEMARTAVPAEAHVVELSPRDRGPPTMSAKH